MKITLDLNKERFHKHFGYENVGMHWFSQIVDVEINGIKVKMQPSQFTEDSNTGRFQVDLEPHRSKEIILAEESVAEAKEALKAAENALKVVKEQK